TDGASTESGPTIRSFVAVPLPGSGRANLMAAAGELAQALPQKDLKWSRKLENLHVTIKFLGPVEETKLASFGGALAASLQALPPFGIEVRGVGAFPSPHKANVLWAGVADQGRLGLVAEAVEEVAARLGIGERSNRPFRAHVTIGRSKQGVDARAALAPFGERTFGAASVDEALVFESRLGSGPNSVGSTYILRHKAALGSHSSN
ncbi:MAG TPA: RNA 2',3'-cyclic phosphodiesterase, partial [Polyangia bacterium]|nr:RNA 2',3'-cyclic phosphodiesterase [Polyangia bacterium]